MKSKLLMCIIALLMLGGCIPQLGEQADLFSSRPSDAQLAQMDYTTPGEIAATYAENTLDADQKYMGKWTKVRGAIDSSPREETDMYHKRTGFSISLGDDKFSSLHCTFPSDMATENALRGLKLGQRVEIAGRLTEYKPGFRAPFLRDCVLIKVID